jgi:16S rRNA (cytosine967-C5)-methyltransferase
MKRSALSSEDAALATRLAYGTLQTQGTLDEALGRYLAKKVEPQVRDALRLSAYELLFMSTAPRAAVHQGVELVRSVRPQAAGLANAVLRKLATDAEAFPWGDATCDVEALARQYGHPLWLARSLVEECGFESAASVMAANNEPAPLYVAVNPFAGTADETREMLLRDGARPVACPIPGAFQLEDASAALKGEAIGEGHAIVTDLSAQLVARLADVDPGETVLEIGSGRGTKTVLLQAAALEKGGEAHIVAVDLHDFKARLLEQRLERLKVPGVTALVGDARDLQAIAGIPELGTVDVALIDAPCTGLGTLRRHPEKRWRVTAEDICDLAVLDSALLEQAASVIRPGGMLVYSTCTLLNNENADVVDAFLRSDLGADFEVDSLEDDVPAEWRSSVTEEGYFGSLPVSGGPDGHFAARLKRRERD